jgi:toxin ParE1/3/4
VARRRPFRIEWTEVAEGDRDSIAAYIARDSIDGALAMLDAIEARVDSLDAMPRRGRAVPELAAYEFTTVREIIEGPYRIVYPIDDAARTVSVVAVIDGRRNILDVLLRRLRRR